MPQPVTAGFPIPSYPSPNISDRILVEFHDPRSTGYQALEYGTPHPDVAQYPGFILVFQEPVELDRWVQRVYVNERLNQDEYNYVIEYPQGGSVKFPRYIRTYVLPDTQTNQPLAPGTPDPVFPGAVLIDQKEEDVDDPRLISKFIKVTRVYDTFASLSPEEQEEEAMRIRSIGEESLIPAKYRRQATTTVLKLPVPRSTPLPTALTGDQTLVRIEDTSVASALQTTVEEDIDVDADPLEGQETDVQGIVLTEESLVPDGTAADQGVMIKASRVVPLGNGTSIKETERYTEFPEFVDHQMDTQFWIPREVHKKIVDATTAAPATIITEDVTGGTNRLITEFQQLDKWRSVRIQTRTKLTGGGTGLLDRPAQIWFGVEQHSFPAELISAEVVVDGMNAVSGGVSLNAFSVEVRVREGYSGPCKTRYTEEYYSIPPEPAEPTTFEPQSFYGHLTTRNTLFGGAPLGIAVTVLPVRIPSCLHGVVDLNVPIYGWKSNGALPTPAAVWDLIYTIPFGSIAATKPAALPRGQYILKDFQTTRVGLGVWRVVKTEVLVPALLT